MAAPPEPSGSASPRPLNSPVVQAAALLATVAPFSDLPRVDRAKLAASLEEVVVEAGAAVYEAGAPADALYVLRHGTLERYSHGRRTAVLEAPLVFGDLSLLRGDARTTSVVAATRAVLWKLPAAQFNALVRRTPGIGARFATAASQRLAASQRGLADLGIEVEALAERLYATLPPTEQRLVERAALLPVLDPHVLAALRRDVSPDDASTSLPLAELLVSRDTLAGSGQAYPAAFRRFVGRRLSDQLGPTGLANERRALALEAQGVGAPNVAIQVLVEGGLEQEAAEVAEREVDALNATGRGEDARRLVLLLPPAIVAGRPALRDVAADVAPARAVVAESPARWRPRPDKLTIGLVAAALALLGGWLIPPPPGLSPAGWHALAALVAVVPLLALDALPEGVLALALAGIWVLGGVVRPAVALGGFATSTWVLVVAILAAGGALASSGLLYRVALWAIATTRGGYVGQVLALGIAGLLIGPAVPNATSRVTLVAPAVRELVDALGYKPRSRASAGLAMAVLVGFGFMTASFLTSSTTTVLVYAVLPEASKANVDWISWAIKGAPANAILFVGLLAFVLWYYRPRPDDSERALGARVDGSLGADGIALQRALLGPPTFHERVSFVVTIALLAGFITQPFHGVDPAWVSVAALAVLAATGTLGADGLRNVNWSFVLLFGILTSMGPVFAQVGLDQWLAGLVTGALGGLTTAPVLFLGALAILCLLVSFVLRWQAAAPLFTIALAPVAAGAGIDPFVIGLVATIACNGFFLPYQSTIYLAMYHGTDGRLFAHHQARPLALAYAALTVLAVCAAVPAWRAMGLL